MAYDNLAWNEGANDERDPPMASEYARPLDDGVGMAGLREAASQELIHLLKQAEVYLTDAPARILEKCLINTTAEVISLLAAVALLGSLGMALARQLGAVTELRFAAGACLILCALPLVKKIIRRDR